MPQKPTTQGAASSGSQAGQRYFATVYDQHRSPRFPNGRPWWGSRELAANKGQLDGFCTTLGQGEFFSSLTDGERAFPVQTEADRIASLASAWDCPWTPPQNGGRRSYYDINYRTMRMQIRYDIVKRDYELAQEQYYMAADKLCAQNGWPEVEFGSFPRSQIVHLIGEPPQSPRIPEAAQAGDPWLLGFTTETNEELAQLLGLSRKGFRRGVDLVKTVPLATPEQVLSVGPDALQQMIADAIAAHEDRKTQERKDKMAHVRAGKPTPAASMSQ